MFDFVRNHTRLFFFVLLLLIIPSFLFFGIEGYVRDTDKDTPAATVGSLKVSQAEWDAEHRQNIERARREMPTLDVKLLDTPEMRQRTLDGLVREKVLRLAADQKHLVPSDERVARIFAADHQFDSLRNPDGTVNKDFLSAREMTSAMFLQRLREDIAQQQVIQPVAMSALAASAVVNSGFDALLQQREVQVIRFDAQKYLSQVKPTEADLQAYYQAPANAEKFKSVEQADVEYVVLNLEALSKDVRLNDEDVKTYYTQNKNRYAVPEERRASHILIKADASATPEDKAKAKAQLQALLKQVKAAPNTFAEVAKTNSQDSSAQAGGDLDFFARGAMVKAFEEAAFTLKVGDISDVIETEFGYHIIKVTDKRGGDIKPFESVKNDIETEIRKQQAQKKFTELATDFSNTVYEQSDSLQAVVDKFQLQLQKATGVTRTPAVGGKGALTNPKLLQALFSIDSIDKKRNTEAVDLGGDQIAAARIVKYQPAQLQSLATVRSKVLAAVSLQQAATLAHKEAKARLVALKASNTSLTEPAMVVSRPQPKDLPPQALKEILQAPATSFPAWVSIDLADVGHMLVKINKLLPRDPAVIDAKQSVEQYTKAWAEAEAAAYFELLKDKAKVKIKAAVLKAEESKQ